MHRFSPARLTATSFLFALALVAGPVACDDGGDDGNADETSSGDGDGDGDAGDGDGDQALSYAADIQPIFDASCVSGCHEAGGAAEATLVLSGNAFDNLVGVESSQPGLILVAAGNAADSYLVAKLRGTGAGFVMPPTNAGGPLPEDTIATVEAWIDAGAQP